MKSINDLNPRIPASGLFLLILALMFLAFGLSRFYWDNKAREVIQDFEVQASDISNLITRELVSNTHSAEGSLLGLSYAPLLRDAVNALNDPGISSVIAIDRLKENWLSFMAVSPNYLQLRYLDNKGIEKFRIDAPEKGEPQWLGSDQLQDKSLKEYFTQALSNKGKMYTSGIDLNVERGVVQTPYTPTLRLSLSPTGLDGVVVLNIRLQPFFDLVEELQERFPLYIANQEGYLLAPKAYAWGEQVDVDKPRLNDHIADLRDSKSFVADETSGLQAVQNTFSAHDIQHEINIDHLNVAFYNLVILSDEATQADLSFARNANIYSYIVITFLFLIIAYFVRKVSMTKVKLQQETSQQARLLEMAVKAGQMSVAELDIDSRTLTHLAGSDPSIKRGKIFSFDHPSLAVYEPVAGSTTSFETLCTQDDVVFDARKLGPDGPIYARFISGESYNREDKLKRIILQENVTATIAAKDELAQSFERQREMFAVIGHELRTPIAAVDMILKDQDLEAVYKLKQIEDINENLISVLDDMRVVVAPERSKEQKVTIEDPAGIVNGAVSPLSNILRENNVELHISLPTEQCHALIARQALRQLTANLVKNAAIHSSGNHIWLTLSYQFEGDQLSGATLQVDDDGKGIAEDQVESMFEPFTRGDTQKDGSGLGLHIVKELAGLLQGEVLYQPSSQGGASFTVNFPLSEANKESQSAKPLVNFKGTRVLLAEDEAVLRMLTIKLFDKAGAEVVACENGRVALETYHRENDKFDFILTDLMMPEMNGKTLIKDLREDGCSTPIIAVTAAVIGEETDELLEAGASAVISKPITLDKLSDVLVKLSDSP